MAEQENKTASAVAEPKTKAPPKPVDKKVVKQMPPFNVILLDDDEHSYEYVIEMLQSVFGFPPEKGYVLAQEVDQTGRVILITTHREKAELKRDQIIGYGTD